MKDIAIYGAGGFGRETAWLIHEINQWKDTWNLVGFYDDGKPGGSVIDGLPVLGGMNEINKLEKPMSLVVAIADPSVRSEIVKGIVTHKVNFPILIHPTAHVGPAQNRIGIGCIVTAGVTLTVGIELGVFTIINLGCTVGHDAHIGDFSSLMPQCSISGNVRVGEKSFLGSGARILQGISLGRNTVVGAGAVVTKSFPDHSRLVGIPAGIVQPKQ